MQQFHEFITWRFVSLNMFRAPPLPSSGAYNCINILAPEFYISILAHLYVKCEWYRKQKE
jgi:hypothetical protein